MRQRLIPFFIFVGMLLVFSYGCSSDSDGPLPVQVCSSPDYSGEPPCATCDTPECCVSCVSGTPYPSCNYETDVAENSNREYITIGGSVVLGFCCFQWSTPPRCGFTPCLEELTGKQISNFGKEYSTISGEIEGSEKFTRVDTSIAMNPNANRVYILMGGNDVLFSLLKNFFQFPKPGNNCRLSGRLTGLLAETVDGLRQIIERYRYHHGIPQVVIASQPPVEEESDAPDSCKSWTQRICPDCYLCINEVLRHWSSMLGNMVASLGGEESGIYFVDLFHIFPEDPAGCSLFCDCVHPNCMGMEIIANAFHDVVP